MSINYKIIRLSKEFIDAIFRIYFNDLYDWLHTLSNCTLMEAPAPSPFEAHSVSGSPSKAFLHGYATSNRDEQVCVITVAEYNPT